MKKKKSIISNINNKDKFITGQLFINTVINDDGIPFDVYLGEHMTIFHRKGNVWIGLPYNKRSNYNDNFKETVGYDKNDHSSELRDFFWDKNNKLLWADKAEFNKQGNNLSIALKSKQSKLELYDPETDLYEDTYAIYYNTKTINKDATFSIAPSTKPSEIAKQLQTKLGTDFVKEEQIAHIERKELGNPNEQTKLENQQKKIFCSPTIWCGLNLCSLCDTGSNKQIS